ncbi:MAG: KDO2-lipid IV(A) lauroyltransferase, partial [Myxococcota bacterium]
VLAAEQSGHEGALVVTAHFGSWEFCAAALAQSGLPVSVVQHGFRNPYVEEVVTGWRNDAGLETLTMGSAAVGVFRALARGRYVALLVDQNAGEDEGVMSPFFTHPASTRSGPAQIAMSRGTAVVPVFFFRIGKSGAHIARIGRPLEMESGETEAVLKRNVDRINAAVEGAIREAPEQWIWSHRRFKTQPEGSRPVYPRRRSALRSLRHALRRRG